MEFGLNWVRMARYGLIFILDGALWLRIISGPLLTPKSLALWPTRGWGGRCEGVPELSSPVIDITHLIISLGAWEIPEISEIPGLGGYFRLEMCMDMHGSALV